MQLLKGHKVDASTAKSISNKASTPNGNRVDTFVMSLFSKIGRAARKGKTHIHHKFHTLFGGVSQTEKEIVIKNLIAHGYAVGTVRRETDAYRISW